MMRSFGDDTTRDIWHGVNSKVARRIPKALWPVVRRKLDQLDSVDEQYFVFYSKGASWRVSYEQINLVEYGQKVDRRYLAAIVISPLFLLSKKRQHFLTLGYTDEEGRQQAMVFKVNKDDIRFLLVSLEARTGRKVQFQDDEARKAGKG